MDLGERHAIKEKDLSSTYYHEDNPMMNVDNENINEEKQYHFKKNINIITNYRYQRFGMVLDLASLLAADGRRSHDVMMRNMVSLDFFFSHTRRC
jgi:hypothetical protein